MDRIAHATAAEDLFGANKDGFTAGEVATQTPATVVTADWLNDVQEAIVRAIEAAGITPVSGTHTQLYDAILAIVANAQPANVISPTAVAGTQNAYEPTGWATAGRVRLTLTGAQTFNGLKLSTVPKLITNVDSADSATFTNMSGSAAVGDKIATHTGASFILGPGESVLFVHDATTNVWRPVALNLLDKANTWSTAQTFSTAAKAASFVSSSVVDPVIEVSGGGVGVQAVEVTGGADILTGSLRVRGASNLLLRDTQEYQYCNAAGAATQPTRTVMLKLSQGGVNDSRDWSLSTLAAGHEMRCDVPLSHAAWEPELPHGCTLTRVRVGVEQGATAATDMALNVYRVPYDMTPGAPTLALIGTDSADDIGVDILSTSFSETYDSSAESIQIKVTSSTAAASATDKIYWIEIQFTDPGPRNY